MTSAGATARFPLRFGLFSAMICDSGKRLLLALTCFCALLTRQASVEAEEIELRVGKATGISFSQVPADVGLQKGIFKRNGLDVELSAFGGGGSLIQALLSDSIDVGFVGTPELSLAAKGAPFKAIGAVTIAPIDLAIFVNMSGTLTSVNDLKGKKIGVTGLHTLTAWVTLTISEHQGWGPDGILLVTSRSPTELIALVRTGEIDGMVGDLTMAFDLEEKGQAKTLLRVADYVPRLTTNIAVASAQAMRDKPKAISAFMTSWLETLAFVRTHKADTVPIFAEVMRRPEDVVSRVYDILVPDGYFSYNGRFDRASLVALGKMYVEMGLLEREPDMNSLYTEEFIPAP